MNTANFTMGFNKAKQGQYYSLQNKVSIIHFKTRSVLFTSKQGQYYSSKFQ